MDEVTTGKKVSVKNEKAVMHPKLQSWLKDNKTTIVYAMVATLLPSVVLSIIYFGVKLNQLSGRLAEIHYHVSSIEGRTASLENRQTEVRGQLTQLDGKLTALSNSPILKEVETLSPRLNLMEKQLASIHVRQKVTPVRSNPVHAAEKQYYEIKEGDNLYQISKKHGLSVEELARMNGLYEDELIVVGQKIVVSK